MHLHLTDGETEEQSDLPKITQQLRGRSKSGSLVSRHSPCCTCCHGRGLHGCLSSLCESLSTPNGPIGSINEQKHVFPSRGTKHMSAE